MASQLCFIAVISTVVAVSYAASFIHSQSDHNDRQTPNVGAGANIDINNSIYGQVDIFIPCDQRSAGDLRAHPGDSAKFMVCSAGVLISFSCPSGNVFTESSKSCVPKTSTTTQTTSQQTCPPGATYLKPHLQECAQFYQCGSPAQEDRWEQHLRECDYPMLFNPATSRCEHYSMVTCGVRREPVDPCEYKANGCGGHAHCVPCNVRYPSCRGKKDGMNSWEGREPSPYYVVCAAQRVVYQGMCAQEHGTHIFDLGTGTCVMMNAKQSLVHAT